MEQFLIYSKNNIVPLVPLVFVLVFISKFIIEILERIGKKAKIHIYPAGKLEIGFSQYGPTIALCGTMRAQKIDAFIAKIAIRVARKDSDFARLMDWRAFKPYVLGLIPDNEIKLELASAFLLNINSPFKCNIVFVDDPFIAKYSVLIPKIQSLWETYKNNQDEEALSNLGASFEQFLKTEEIRDIIVTFTDAFYWEPGSYSLEMFIHTSNPDKIHKTLFAFDLSIQQTGLLKENIIKIIQLICNIKVNCKYVFSEYK
ncbi:MAG: hypothetical protein HQK77_15970 [Desulfobacterales bacterium]|nr:hypothetical protein [Desulfobacterales bacterium]